VVDFDLECGWISAVASQGCSISLTDNAEDCRDDDTDKENKPQTILLLHFVNEFVDWEISDIASFVKTPILRVVEGFATVLIRVRLASRTRHASSAWLEGAEEQGS
jgi:hypothetical protein